MTWNNRHIKYIHRAHLISYDQQSTEDSLDLLQEFFSASKKVELIYTVYKIESDLSNQFNEFYLEPNLLLHKYEVEDKV